MNEILTLTLMLLGDLNQSQIRQRKHDQESNQEPGTHPAFHYDRGVDRSAILVMDLIGL